MCSTPSAPQVTQTKAADPVATPTYADAAVQKAGENTRTQTAALSSRNVKTSAVGDLTKANTRKTELGGGSSIKTTALGLTDEATVKKTRLGE